MSDVIFSLILIVIWLAAIIGWIWNIIKVIATISDPVTGMFVLRCVGIIVAPLGAIVGWF